MKTLLPYIQSNSVCHELFTILAYIDSCLCLIALHLYALLSLYSVLYLNLDELFSIPNSSYDITYT